MAKYFFVSQGLRGCYMPDNTAVIKCDTRRELKSYLESEAYDLKDAGFKGANKKAIAWLAAQSWSKAGHYDNVIPLKPSHSDSYCFGLFVSKATRQDYLDAENNY